MSVTPKAGERRAFIDRLFPLGLSVREVALAANCSEGSILKDMSSDGGVNNSFPHRPTKKRKIYVRVLDYFSHRFDDRVWRNGSEARVIEDHLNFQEVWTFVTGMCTAYEMLILGSCEQASSESELMRALFGGHNPRADYMIHQDFTVQGYLRVYLVQCYKLDRWPETSDELKLGIANHLRANLDRQNLRAPSSAAGRDKLVRAALASLTPREILVIQHRFGIGQTAKSFKGVAGLLDVNIERVRQIQAKAIRKLRHPSRSTDLRSLHGETIKDLMRSEVARQVLKKELVRMTGMYRESMAIASVVLEAEQQGLESSAVLDLPGYENLHLHVDGLEFSVRTQNCLQNSDIVYVFQLVQMTEAQLLKTKNFGRKSLNEVKESLHSMDLSFGMELSSSAVTMLQALCS